MSERAHRVWRKLRLRALHGVSGSGRWMRARFRLVRSERVSGLPVLYPQPAPLFARTQVRLGRLLGRLYLGYDAVRERCRIARSRLPERVHAQRIGPQLMRLQKGVLLAPLVLGSAAFAADVVMQRYGDPVADWGPFAFLAKHLQEPTPATLQAILVATAAATGTILGLVLTISLIVFQATADRYESDRIVSFLLRERVGAYVVRLLAVAFVYSLWLLALLHVVSGYTPYLATFLALALGTLGVVALITYREHALFGYLPANIFAALEREAKGELARLVTKRPGRSVETHARRTVAQDVGTAEDLLRGLAQRSDWRGVTAGVEALQHLLDAYLELKRVLADDSEWWERTDVRLSAQAHEVTERIVRQGLLPPTEPRRRREWLEVMVIEASRPVLDAGALADESAANALLLLYGHAVQLAWRQQEFEVLDALFERVEALGTHPEVVARHAQAFVEIAWVLVNDAARGLTSSPAQIVASEPWKRRPGTVPLPFLARREADALAVQIRKELAITGRIVTPRSAMESEVGARWATLSGEHRDRYLQRAFDLALAHLRAVIAAREEGSAGPAAEMLLRLLLRCLELGARPPLAHGALRRELVAAYPLMPAGEPREHFKQDALFVATRVLAEQEQWELALELLELVAATLLTDRSLARQPAEQLVQEHDALLTFACVYGRAELRQWPGVVPFLDRWLPALWNLEELVRRFDDGHGRSSLYLPFVTSVKYTSWFQPLRQAAAQLPDRYAGSFVATVGKDHPSPLFRRWRFGSGHDDVLAQMVLSRTEVIIRRQLFELIERRIQALEQQG